MAPLPAKLTFNEEFDSDLRASPTGYDASNSPVWQSQWFWGARYSDDTTAGEYFSDASVGYNPFSVSNGVLSIKAIPVAGSGVIGAQPWATHASGMLDTDKLFNQKFGYFEVRAQNAPGDGFLSAFWLIPQDHSWPPELDISEVDGGEPGTVITTAHSNATGIHTSSVGWSNQPDTTTGFHTYGMDWGPEHTVWYFNGKEVYRVATPVDANKPMHFVIDLAAGTKGSWHGDATDTASSELKVDYVRVWEWKAGGPPPGALGSPPVARAAASYDLGAGPELVTIKLSEDAYQGDAQFIVKVDGKQVGGTMTAQSTHGSGVADTVNLHGAFGGGTHQVSVIFLNDAWGGTAATDRNLYVDAATYNGKPIDAAKALFAAGDTAMLEFSGDFAPTSKMVGSGDHSLTLKISQDYWRAAAQYTVTVDGKQVGGVYTASALHAADQDDVLVIKGDWSAGPHRLSVTFLNDAWGGTAAADRNLYVEAVSYDGQSVGGAKAMFGSGAHADYTW